MSVGGLNRAFSVCPKMHKKYTVDNKNRTVVSNAISICLVDNVFVCLAYGCKIMEVNRANHKRTGSKNLGGNPTRSQLFANIFDRLRGKIFPNGD